MGRDDWDDWMESKADDLLREAERIRSHLAHAASWARIEPGAGEPGWRPAINIVEMDGSVFVVAALPGVAADRLHLLLEGDVLCLSGERSMREQVGALRYRQLEIPFGRFERRVRLPRPALELESWKLKDGLLWIELRRRP